MDDAPLVLPAVWALSVDRSELLVSMVEPDLERMAWSGSEEDEAEEAASLLLLGDWLEEAPMAESLVELLELRSGEEEAPGLEDLLVSEALLPDAEDGELGSLLPLSEPLELLPESPDVPEVPEEPEVLAELVDPLVDPRSLLVLLDELALGSLDEPACWAESVDAEPDWSWVCWSLERICDELDGSDVADEPLFWSANDGEPRNAIPETAAARAKV